MGLCSTKDLARRKASTIIRSQSKLWMPLARPWRRPKTKSRLRRISISSTTSPGPYGCGAFYVLGWPTESLNSCLLGELSCSLDVSLCMAISFKPVTIKVSEAGETREISTVEDARDFIRWSWPRAHNGVQVRVLVSVLEAIVEPWRVDQARSAFIAAARKSNILISE